MKQTAPTPLPPARKRAFRPLGTAATLAVLAGALLTSASAQITLDGILSDDDNYSDHAIVTYFNGHDEDSYGDFDTQSYETLVYYGTGTLAGDDSGTEYFFVLAEAPIEIKNMVWGDGMTTQDIADYGTDMDFSKATGSEELNLLDTDGSELLTVDLGSNVDGGKTKKGGADGSSLGFIDFRDSVDYLVGLDTSYLVSSDAADRSMSYEMRFSADSADAVIAALNNGIDFHLSPDRSQDGLMPDPQVQVVPEPSSALLVGSAGMLLLLRRRRGSNDQ